MIEYPTYQRCLKYVAKRHGLTVADMLGDSKHRAARNQALFLCYIMVPGATHQSIGKATGVHHKTVGKVVADQRFLITGFRRRDPRLDQVWRIQIIQKMRDEGKSWEQIGAEIGTTADAARTWANNNLNGRPSRRKDARIVGRGFAGRTFPTLKFHRDRRPIGLPSPTWAPSNE